MDPIAISAYGAVSALGNSPDKVWAAYQQPVSAIRYCSSCRNWVSKLDQPEEEKLIRIRERSKHFRKLDRSVLLAILSVHQVRASAKLQMDCAINWGSSRGATALFEHYLSEFLDRGGEQLSPFTSPSTTLGNLSSNVAAYLGLEGLAMSHSITCSTALHSVLNGIAWLKSGMVRQFLAGGAEAPLTPFTIAQMQALQLYSDEKTSLPCRALDLRKQRNTMVLGEGAGCFLLEQQAEVPLAFIRGAGYAMEKIRHATSLSENGDCLQRSMKMALRQLDPGAVDAVVMHSPGTVRGDMAEWKAVRAVFGENIPFLTTNKWKIGHTLGASGALSLELALLMLNRGAFVGSPFYSQPIPESKPNHILVNAVGFGGNAVSILLSRS